MAVDIKLEGKEVVKSVCDLFSPVTELAGTLGDKIKIYRELSVLRTLNKAKEIARKEGLELGVPPLKFLVPYLEAVSIENEEDFDLQKLWANLLVSSSDHFQSEYNLFIRVLNEISSKEAAAFSFIVKSSEHDLYENSYWLEDAQSNWQNSYVYITLRNMLNDEQKNDYLDIDFGTFEKNFRSTYQQPGSYIYFFDVNSGEKDIYPLTSVYTSSRSSFDDLWIDKHFSILISLGLIGQFESPEYWFKNVCFNINAYYITPLGASFYESCVVRANKAKH